MTFRNMLDLPGKRSSCEPEDLRLIGNLSVVELSGFLKRQPPKVAQHSYLNRSADLGHEASPGQVRVGIGPFEPEARDQSFESVCSSLLPYLPCCSYLVCMTLTI